MHPALGRHLGAALAPAIDLPGKPVPSCKAVKDPQDRIRELEDHCEALENALEQIRVVAFEPKLDAAGKAGI